MVTTTRPSDLAVREYWLLRQDELRTGNTAAGEVLGVIPGQAGGGKVSHPLPADVSTAVDQVAREEPLLRWAVTAAACALVLRRFGAENTVTLVTGAPLPHAVPAEHRPDPTLTFRQWLVKTRDVAVDAITNRGAEDGLLSGLLPDGPVIAVGAPPRDSALDPAVTVEIADGQVVVSARCETADVLNHLALGVVEVLRQGLADPDRRLADIGVLDEATRHQVLVTFNEAGALDATVPYRDLLLAQVERTPHAVAIHDGQESFTYRELCIRAAAIALRLRENGIGREDQVALVSSRNAWFLVMAVGVLFAGGVYVPVDPTVPERRRALLTGQACLVVLDEAIPYPADVHVPCLRTDSLRTAQGPASSDAIRRRLGPPPAPEDLAYVIFTSGSTGTPKGAGVEHHSFLNLLATRVRDYGLSPGTEVPQTAPLTFDLSIWQMFAGLTSGATICVVADEVVRDPAALAAMTVEHGFACLALVPTFIVVLADHLEDDPDSARAVRSHLRLLVSTGELLSGDLARRWHRLMPGVDLHNAYGPAEVADDSTGGPVAPEGVHTSIGSPLPHVRVRVLDVDLHPVPPGVAGELYIGGASVGRGYLGVPAKTAAAFLPDLFADAPGQRMYRTGDRGRWRLSGEVELLGRADNQVKIRGRRVELGEIAYAVEAHPALARAVVELLDANSLQRLVAFVTTKPGATVTGHMIKEFCADRLPAYMVPGEVLFLDELPRNPNGKVDRGRLAAVAKHRATSDDEYVPPRTELEAALCALWADHLHLERVGVTDDFFRLGGDSILGIRIAQDAGRQGLLVRPNQLLQGRTVEALASLARAKTDGVPTTGPDPSTPISLTPPQLTFFAREVANPDHWNHGVRYTLGRSFSLESVERAVGMLAKRHPALRTRVVRSGTELRQIASPEPPPVTEFDLRDVPPAEADDRVHALATTLHASLDLRDGPICRAGLFRFGTGLGDRLVVVVHHAMVDLYSWNIITDEVATLLRDGHDQALGPVPDSYLTWAHRFAELVREKPDLLDIGYWLSVNWADSGRVFDSGEPGVEGNTGELTATFGPEWTQRFLVETTAAGYTVEERLLAALGAAVGGLLDEPAGSVSVQLGGHGREDVVDELDIGGTVGYFSTGYPFALPTGAGREATVASRLRALPWRGLTFEAVRHLHPDPDTWARLGAVPVPRLLFNYWGEPAYLAAGRGPGPAGVLSDVRTDVAGDDRPADLSRPFPVEVYPSIVDSRLNVLVRFSSEVVPRTWAQALLDSYTSTLRQTVAFAEGAN